jgi:hypothetical protein
MYTTLIKVHSPLLPLYPNWKKSYFLIVIIEKRITYRFFGRYGQSAFLDRFLCRTNTGEVKWRLFRLTCGGRPQVPLRALFQAQADT